MNRIDVAGVMEFLYVHRAPDLPPQMLADVLDRLIWSLDDSGDELLRVREAWLQSSDRGRVEVALAMNETFPFKEQQQMETVFRGIVESWPELRDRCDELRRQRDQVTRR